MFPPVPRASRAVSAAFILRTGLGALVAIVLTLVAMLTMLVTQVHWPIVVGLLALAADHRQPRAMHVPAGDSPN